MRRARHSARPLSTFTIALAIALCATAALALPLKAEAVIHLGSPNTVSLSNGLVGYWPLDGATISWSANPPTFRDLSGLGNHATSTTMSTSSSPVAGKIGQALNFNGSDQQIYLSTVGGYSDKVTVAAWFYHRSITDPYDDIIGSNCGDIIIYFDSASIHWAQQCGNEQSNTDIAVTNTFDNAWHHVVGVTNGANSFLYIEVGPVV